MASPEEPPRLNSQPTPTSTSTPTPARKAGPRSRKGGRPRANFDDHKAQILALYAAKTPWTQIEAILFADHGIKAQGRTIMRRMKDEWGVEFRRVETDRSQTDQVKARIAALWADRETRPKDDTELHARLKAEGFTVSVAALLGLRKEMRLFRRWDEKFGRVRPDEELGRRKKRRKQKHSAYTGAQLALPGGAEDEAGEEEDSDEDGSSPDQPLAEPTREGWYPGLTLPKPKSRKYRRQQKSLSTQPSQPEHTPPQPARPSRSTPPRAVEHPLLAPQQLPQSSTAFSDTDKDM